MFWLDIFFFLSWGLSLCFFSLPDNKPVIYNIFLIERSIALFFKHVRFLSSVHFLRSLAFLLLHGYSLTSMQCLWITTPHFLVSQQIPIISSNNYKNMQSPQQFSQALLLPRDK